MGGDLPVVGTLQSDSRQVPVNRCAGYSVVQCPAVQTAECGSLARAVLSTASTDYTVLVLTSRHISDLKSDASYQSPPVHCLSTKAWTDPLPCPSLPQPHTGTLHSLSQDRSSGEGWCQEGGKYWSRVEAD